jgi:hypothetical protein
MSQIARGLPPRAELAEAGRVRRLVRSEPTLKRFMTAPGVGPITAVGVVRLAMAATARAGVVA